MNAMNLRTFIRYPSSHEHQFQPSQGPQHLRRMFGDRIELSRMIMEKTYRHTRHSSNVEKWDGNENSLLWARNP